MEDLLRKRLNKSERECANGHWPDEEGKSNAIKVTTENGLIFIIFASISSVASMNERSSSSRHEIIYCFSPILSNYARTRDYLRMIKYICQFVIASEFLWATSSKIDNLWAFKGQHLIIVISKVKINQSFILILQNSLLLKVMVSLF